MRRAFALCGVAALCLIAALYGPAPAQNGTFKVIRASDVVVVATLPTVCPPGRIFIKTGGSSGLYICVTRNTPVASGSGGGGGVAGLTVDGDGTVKAGVALTMSAPSTPTYNASGNTTCDLSASNFCAPTAIATGGTTLVLSNPHGGGPYFIMWTQSASPISTPITYPGTMANCPQPSPTALKITLFEFTWDGSAYHCLGSNDALDTPITVLSGDISTPGSGSGVTTIGVGKVAPAMMKASTVDGQTDGSTITWAIGSVLNAQGSVTLGGNRTLAITNPVIGGNYWLKVTQDGTGTRTLTPGTGCTWLVLGGTGGGTFALSTAAGKIDIVAFTYDGTNCLATVGKAYAAP